MVEREVTVLNKLGIHARPAALLVRKAAQFKSDIFLVKNGQQINGKSIMGVMSLAAEHGSKLIIRAIGEDEKEAAAKIAKLFEDKFEED